MFVVGAQGFRIFLIFASLVILSRLLSPEDFGLYACLTPVIGFISLFQDLGLQQAVVQRSEITDDQLNRIFWIVLAVGVICAIALCLVSPLIVWFYHEPRLLWLAVAASASLILTSLASLPSSLLNRTMRFKAMATIDVAANLLGFIAAVVGALLGLNYWALIMTPLLVAFVTASGSFWASRWRPSHPRLTIGRDILGFGANLTGFNFVNFFARNLDNILIGRYRGAQELGFYDRGYKLLMFPLISLNYPLSRVVVPILSRMQHDKERVRRTYLRIVGLLTLATVPGMAAALAVPHNVILLLFGEKWLPVVPIFYWLGLAGLVQPLNSTSGWLYISQGKTKEMFRWGLFASSTTIISFLIGLHWGAVGIAAGYALSEYFVRLPGIYWCMHKIGPVKIRDLISVQFPLLLSAFISWLAITFFLQKGLNLHGPLLIGCAFLCSYGFAVFITSRHRFGKLVLNEAVQIVMKNLLFLKR